MGKILDYFDSEERAYDVLETTCDGLKDYALGKGENRALQWLQMDGEKKTRQKMLVSFAGEPNEKNAQERGLGSDWKERWKTEGKKLMQWCQLFLEDQEELLLKLLKEKVVTKETAKAGILVDLMCKEENALQTFKRKPPCSDKADSVLWRRAHRFIQEGRDSDERRGDDRPFSCPTTARFRLRCGRLRGPQRATDLGRSPQILRIPC